MGAEGRVEATAETPSAQRWYRCGLANAYTNARLE
jgi:hypothetical protein